MMRTGWVALLAFVLLAATTANVSARRRRGPLRVGVVGTGLIGTTAATTAITIGHAAATTTFQGPVTVAGMFTATGGEVLDGLVQLTSSITNLVCGFDGCRLT